VNLYVTVPAHHPGANPADYFTGSARSVGWSVSEGPVWLAVHASLGLALVLTRLMGIVGAGVAVLASQLITMILILPGLRAILAGRGRQPALTAAEGELS